MAVQKGAAEMAAYLKAANAEHATPATPIKGSEKRANVGKTLNKP